jgi:flagellar hook assembly protein FlgD
VVPVASLTLTPATGDVFVGSVLSITAQSLDSANTVLVGRTITWATDNAAVASVSGAGVVTGISTGTATITATSEGRTATARVTVSVAPTGPATVRFFNATTGMAGSGGFTTNGQFATGSALAFGQSTQSCATVTPGSTSFGFGAANTGGTGLSGSALATLGNQSITPGGNYTVVATGVATSPTLFLLDNTFAGTLAANQAAVRFVNLARGTGTTANTFVVFAGAFGSNETPIEFNLAVGAPTAYGAVTGGANTFSVLQNPGHNLVIPSVTVTLQAGTVNTLAIVPNPATAGFQLINIPRC